MTVLLGGDDCYIRVFQAYTGLIWRGSAPAFSKLGALAPPSSTASAMSYDMLSSNSNLHHPEHFHNHYESGCHTTYIRMSNEIQIPAAYYY